jgi:hypothetical protein
MVDDDDDEPDSIEEVSGSPSSPLTFILSSHRRFGQDPDGGTFFDFVLLFALVNGLRALKLAIQS